MFQFEDGQVVAQLGEISITIKLGPDFNAAELTSEAAIASKIAYYAAKYLIQMVSEGKELPSSGVVTVFLYNFEFSWGDPGENLIDVSLEDGVEIAKLGPYQVPLVIHFQNEKAKQDLRESDSGPLMRILYLMYLAADRLDDMIRAEEELPAVYYVTVHEEGNIRFTNEPMTDEEMTAYLAETHESERLEQENHEAMMAKMFGGGEEVEVDTSLHIIDLGSIQDVPAEAHIIGEELHARFLSLGGVDYFLNNFADRFATVLEYFSDSDEGMPEDAKLCLNFAGGDMGCVGGISIKPLNEEEIESLARRAHRRMSMTGGGIGALLSAIVSGMMD